MRPATSFRGSRTDTIEGIIVRVKMDGHEVREFKFPSHLNKKWDAAAADKEG